MAVKYRLFRHLAGGSDIEAESLYDWHILKRSGHRMKAGIRTDQYKTDLDDYRRAATRLFRDMEKNGFRHEGAIPVDCNGELLGGAHRVACALALGIAGIMVFQSRDAAWAPPWGEAWFRQEGLSQTHIEELRQTMAELAAR